VNYTRIPERLLDPEVIGPLIVTPAFFFSVITAIVVVFWFRGRSERARHEMLTLLVEKGQPVPPELFASARRPASDLRRGAVLLALGIGVGVALLIAGVGKLSGLALIPAFTGAGYLVVWRIEARKRGDG
jgi:Domain of unknown function (DUF6249)